MKKIAIINQKGGTGKTTTAVHLGVGLAEKGKKVLLVDMDPQGNLTTWLEVESEHNLHDLLVQDEPLKNCIANVQENLDVLPSDSKSVDAEEYLSTQTAREHVLKNKLSKAEGYDFVMLDCPPSRGLLNQNALVYAEEAYLPVSTKYLSIVGLSQLMENITIIREKLGEDIKVSLVIPTMYDQRENLSDDSLDMLGKHFDKGKDLADPIRKNVRLAEAPARNKTVYEHAPESHGAKDYRRLVKRVMKDV